MLIETIQSLTGVAATLLGAAYIIGGLIVNLHLSNYRITEYQVVRVKYLVVGLVYLVGTSVLISVATLTNFVIISQVADISYVALASLSLLAATTVILIWLFGDRLRPSRFRFLLSWNFIVVASVISFCFPIMVMIRQSFGGSTDAYSALLIVTAVIIAILAVVGQLYYFSREVYGAPFWANFDPIGMGVPVAVKLAGTEADITLLSHMGLPVSLPDLTDKVFLVDETDSHYILSLTSLETSRTSQQVFKVNKELVKGVVYLN
ncbi:MAG: hypothetical protein ABI947_06260 [Chloroflexota bacterium]